MSFITRVIISYNGIGELSGADTETKRKRRRLDRLDEEEKEITEFNLYSF